MSDEEIKKENDPAAGEANGSRLAEIDVIFPNGKKIQIERKIQSDGTIEFGGVFFPVEEAEKWIGDIGITVAGVRIVMKII